MRELTRRNDHPAIQTFWTLIHPAYYRSRPPWCAAFVYFCLRSAGLRPPVKTPALAAAWYRKSLTVWTYNPHGNQRRGAEPPKASLVLYQFKTAGGYRIGHVGLLADQRRKATDDFMVLEGNTSAAGAVELTERDREGNGVYLKRRSPRSIYAIVDWIPISMP
ncbi:CHAP domain-containing protein [Larkinella soli]|uniref:CHAP domain-containing protein n=1 Tax=Larkinella soli TaxID=1770527 RepID=UPI0013E3489E|nr:CHAP domain-containing protein [Larkinella soli]